MKTIKLFKILIILLVTCNACSHIERNDSGIDTELKTVIYKTKGDYFNYVNIWGHFISAPSCVRMKDSMQIGVIGEDTIYKLRWKLENGYIMDLNSSLNDYFTNMTFVEIVRYNEQKHDGSCYPLEKIFKRVIDKNPFTEYYVDMGNQFYHRDSIDIQEINKLIKTGNLESVFTKRK